MDPHATPPGGQALAPREGRHGEEPHATQPDTRPPVKGKPVSPHRKIDPDTSQILVLLLTRLVGTYAIINGVGIILGGRQRWEGNPALEAALSFPAAPASWGFVALVLGVLTMVGTFTYTSLAMFGCWGIAMWAAFFAVTLTVSAATSPVAPTTGPPTYALVALVSVALAIPWRQPA